MTGECIEGKHELRDSEKSERVFISETLIIATLTATGYISAFLYQSSFLNYFGIPAYFVDIKLSSLLLISIFAILWLYSVGLLIYFIYPKSKDSRIKKIFKRTLFLLIFLGPLWLSIFFGLYDPDYKLLAVIVFIILIFCFVWANINVDKKIEKYSGQNSEFFEIIRLVGEFRFLFLISVIYFILTCSAFGSIAARIKYNHLISNTTPPILLLATYEGNLLGLEYSTSTNKIYSEIRLITPEQITREDITFKVQRIRLLPKTEPLWQVFISERVKKLK